ncbi:MAG: carboxypeptidase regulatory-like domain-containing protein, partial [Candidatus Cloacimonetes bacterium]|nr:carboxypeptidase regulatory-like domain-containing protein [Candidatus Cloacimonadota bacterium]
MKRRIILPLLLALFTLGAFGVWAQTLEYGFAQSTTTYTPITGGILLGTETSDDQRYVDPANPTGGTTTTGPGFDIGFNFAFNGAVFDRLAVNTNGWISLGQSALTPSVNNASSSSYTPLASTTTIDPAILYNRIAGMARDIQSQTGASIRLETIGTAPNRVCVVQWDNFKKYGTSGTGDSFDFQIRLHETTNQVQIVYGSCVSNATAGNMQVGLRGPDAADFNARQSATGWDNTTPATANNEYVVMTDVFFPANGLTFSFNYPVADQPPNPANLVSPADGATLVSPTTTLNWMSGGGLPNAYRLSFGTDPAASNIVNNQDLGNVNSYDPDPDLLPSTTYYWKIVPYNNFGNAPNCPIWSFTTHGDATVTTLPYSQNWDLVTTPELPFDWMNIVQSSSTSAFVGTYSSTTYAHSQPNTARLYNPSDADATLILVGPPIGGTLNLNEVRLRFWARSSGANYPLSIGVISNPADPSTYADVHNLSLTTTLTEYVLSLAGYTGTANRIAFKHGLGGTSRSHYIDDIVFEQIAPNDLACEALTGNSTPSLGSPTTYTAHIHNWGTATQSAYTVKLFNGDNVELVSVPGTTIAPDATVQIPMTWTPTAEGTMTLYAKVFLAGDINPANDQSPDLNILVMGAGTLVVSIGDGTAVNGTSGSPTPYGTYYKNFHQQYLFTAAELLASGGAPGPITSLAFNVQALNNCSPMPNYTIKLKHTTQSVLTTTFEVGDYTQVWYQNDFLPIEGWNTHAFSAPFLWDGTSNLLVDIITTLIPGAYTQNASVYYTPTTGTNTSLRYQSDSADAAGSLTGTLSVNRANTRLSFNLAGLGALTGTVTSGGSPLTGVDVAIQGTNHATQTDALGLYNFPFVDPGTYSVSASKLGYESQTLPVTLVPDETTTQNFNLAPSTTISVSGTVVGSDQPTVGLADVAITLDGALDYSGITNASGQFTITGVLSGNSYSYILVKDGYQDLTGTITVGATNYDMGTLTMAEIALPPFNVQATENTAQTQVSLTWLTPTNAGGGLEDFEINNGDWVSSGFGDWQWDNDYNVANYTDIDTYVDEPPATAHSGTGMWGTVLTGGYSNCNDWSYLRKTFNLSGCANPVLDFWHYMDGYNTWDYGLIKVNGTTVWGASSAAVFMPWQQLVIDLSAYANQAEVEISFEWFATSVVSYAGWYIDDVYVGPAQNRTVNYVYTPVPDGVNAGSEVSGAALRQSSAWQGRSQFPVQSVNREPARVRTGYLVWRLLEGNEDNEASWTPLTPAAIQDTSYVDTAWGGLPDGNYRWAVKATYTNNVLSNAAFSNMIRILRLDLSALNISGSTTPSVGMEASYQVEVQNTGTTTQQGTAYTVKLMAGTTELASVPGVTLAPDESHVFAITWTPATPGPLALTGKAVLPNDAQPDNDETEALNISVMPAGVVAVTVGDGSAVEGRPLDFYYNNSLFQCLYFPDEIQMYGSITALSFYNNFVTDLPNEPTKIWLGQTDLNDLSGGWILPTGNLTLVYDGNISYPSGENTVTIPLQTPFNYTSGNLVLYANRPMDDTHYNTNDNFRVQTVGSSRARKLTSNTTNYDPLSPSAAGTLSAQFPMTTFHLAAIGDSPIFAINPTARDFGTVLINGEYTQEFTISNAGGGAL